MDVQEVVEIVLKQVHYAFARKRDNNMSTLNQIAKKLAEELGPSHKIFSSYAISQTPRRMFPLLQLIELYISVKGEQTFIDNYKDESALYYDFLQQKLNFEGEVTIRFGQAIIAKGQL